MFLDFDAIVYETPIKKMEIEGKTYKYKMAVEKRSDGKFRVWQLDVRGKKVWNWTPVEEFDELDAAKGFADKDEA
ncbi:MAG: hypothetical protein FOGNACKC_00832 [Anaerolineae bacterium]|nr:hypothetical protein [Anaerolineae bacterium]